MDLTFNETLVGEAAQVCMRMNFQPALYVMYLKCVKPMSMI